MIACCSRPSLGGGDGGLGNDARTRAEIAVRESARGPAIFIYIRFKTLSFDSALSSDLSDLSLWPRRAHTLRAVRRVCTGYAAGLSVFTLLDM